MKDPSMNQRECFFAVLDGQPFDKTPYFPDITNWYDARRVPRGAPQKYSCGEFIPDDDPYHNDRGDMPEEYTDWTFLDFYRNFGWGLPVHLYEWYSTEYEGRVELVSTVEDSRKISVLHTPEGSLTKISLLAEDGSWAPHEHFVKTIEDLDIIEYAVARAQYTPLPEKSRRFYAAAGDFGVCDIPINRSPFGKLVHEYMGFQQTVFALMDHRDRILDFLAFQEEHDLTVIRMAAEYPADTVIISDHADENLISPPQYEEYCIPFYQKACGILHDKGKFVSTHLDGNFKGFFPVIHETGFDFLDGCTPAPMFNYEVEELAEALGDTMHAYCGVPATLFTQHLDTAKITDFGTRIINAFDGKVILNIGDILPQNADIEQAVELGKM
jgi:hypothetical protein